MVPRSLAEVYEMPHRHLNITREEADHVLVDYDVNRFVADLVTSEGHPIRFLETYEWVDMDQDPEMVKYRDDWGLKVRCTAIVHNLLRAL